MSMYLKAGLSLLKAIGNLTGLTLNAPTITDFTNANHTHAGASTGGTVAHTALTSIGTNTHAQIDTFMAAIDEGAWTTWTPTITQGVGVTLTNTYARYAIVGKIAHVQFRLVATSAGTEGSTIVVGGLPAAVAPKNAISSGTYVGGVGTVNDVGTAIYTGGAVSASASTVQFISNAGTNFVGATPSFALANNDEIGGDFSYEIA